MKKLSLLIIVLFILTNYTNAQLKKTLYLDKIDTICTNTKVNINVRATNFSNIIGFQGSIGWDSTVVAFDTLMYGSNINGINLNDSNTNIQITKSHLSFVWIDSFAQTIPDNTILFTLGFSISNSKGNKTPIFFNKADNNVTPLEIDTLNLNTLIPVAATDTAFIDGYIGFFVDTPKIFQNGNVLTGITSCNPIKFQWYLNGNPIQHDTTNSITISSTGNYSVCATYSNGNRVYSSTTNIMLPLEVLSFDALYANNSTTIKWTTANELNTAYFNVGRKINDGMYQTINTINTKGSIDATDYNIVDTDKNRGVIYYQLEIVDKDATKHYSRIISVNPKSAFVYTISTIPAHNQIKIEGDNITQIDLLDNVGHLLIRKRYAVLSSHSFSTKIINTKSLTPGVYFSKIYNLDKSSKIEKVVIN